MVSIWYGPPNIKVAFNGILQLEAFTVNGYVRPADAVIWKPERIGGGVNGISSTINPKIYIIVLDDSKKV